MNVNKSFQRLINKLSIGLKKYDLPMFSYLYKDSSETVFHDAASFFEYLTITKKITPYNLSFISEMMYRIKRDDLLQVIRVYEDNFFLSQSPGNFSPFRLACFKLLYELSPFDVEVIRIAYKDKLSDQGYRKSTDALSLLTCLEEEHLFSNENFDFMLNCLRHRENKAPYLTVLQLKKICNNFDAVQSSNWSSNSRCFQSYEKLNTTEQLPFDTNSSLSNVPTASTDLTHTTAQSIVGEQRAFLQEVDQGDVNKVVSDPTDPTSYAAISEDVANMDLLSSSNEHVFSQETNHISCSKTLGDENLPCSGTTEVSVPLLSSTRQSRGCQPEASERFSEAVKLFSKPGFLTEPCPLILRNDTNFQQHKPENAYMHHSKFSLTAVSERNIECFEPERYKMDKNPAGICLIINNSVFKSAVGEKDLTDRKGSDKDVDMVSNLFESFGFQIAKEPNLKSQEMLRVLKKYSQKNHSTYNCFIAVIMSHGCVGGLYGTDGKEVTISQIQGMFKPKNCSTLIDKPKIFFFQACQGERPMSGHLSDTPKPTGFNNSNFPLCGAFQNSISNCLPDPPDMQDDIETDGPPNQGLRSKYLQTPKEADFFLGYSTVPGYISYRSKTHGSFYIYTLVTILRKFHGTEDLSSMMVRVNKEIAMIDYKQMPMYIVTLRKNMFFEQRKESQPHCSYTYD